MLCGTKQNKMMRHLRVLTATVPQSAIRSKMTGFNLFVREVQSQQRVLNAKSLEGGQRNMKIMSALWRKLSTRRRVWYNNQALQCSTFTRSDPEKKNNPFNLLMRLFSADKMLLSVGDPKFTSLLAKSTMQAMSKRDLMRLQARFKVNHFCPSAEKSRKDVNVAFRCFGSPRMVLFRSFSDMQRSVAPTRKAAFTAITKALTLSSFTFSGEEYVMKRYDALPQDLRNLFAPISDVEAPHFEVFCANRCASFDREKFDIMRLFAAFRGIKIDLSRDIVKEGLYRSLLHTDRSHDGIFFRSRRSLERLEALRSSDCGLLIAKQCNSPLTVPPTCYGIQGSLSDVEVATMMAETRDGQSVYDDVLRRATLLRPPSHQKKLQHYDVAHIMEIQAARQAASAAKQELSKVVALHVLTKDLTARSKREAPRQTRKSSTAAQRKVSPPLPSVARVRKVPPPPRAKRPLTAQQSHAQRKAASNRKRRSTVGSVASPPLREAVTMPAAAKVREAAKQLRPREGRDSQKGRHKRITTSAVVKKPTPITQDEQLDDEDPFSAAEELMGEVEADAEEFAVVDQAANTSVPKVRSPPVTREKRKGTPRGRARSGLDAPRVLLPVMQHTQKMITKHTVERRKLPRAPTSISSSPTYRAPFVPTDRNGSFADNIRAQLASFL